jgi:hypothetical protein
MPIASPPDSNVGVYRTPGRVVATVPQPLARWRTLLAPLTRAGVCALLAVLPRIVVNLCRDENTRPTPLVEGIGNAFLLGLPVSLVLLGCLIATRVVPALHGVLRHKRVAYFTAITAAQLAVVFAASAATLFAPGGFRLFDADWVSATHGPHGETAHLYKDAFIGCFYDVYVAEPRAFTMGRRVRVQRDSCAEPAPTVRWNAAEIPELVDATGKVLQSQPWLLPWAQGC